MLRCAGAVWQRCARAFVLPQRRLLPASSLRGMEAQMDLGTGLFLLMLGAVALGAVLGGVLSGTSRRRRR